MKSLFRILISTVLVIVVAVLLPAQVFADSVPQYISDVKVYYGEYKDGVYKGYSVLKDANGKPVDLNQKAGGGWGSKGEQAVYLYYKTTTDKDDAITDLALMNMKGGYSTAEYKSLMETYLKSQIIPFVDNFLSAINEFRENYKSSNPDNKERADYVYNALNKFIDDDTGRGLGDLFLNETKYEMGDEAYNKLSDEEKKNHADILTIFAQSNGKATLLMQNLIMRATDTNDDNWLDRFSKTTYDDLVDLTGMTPTDAGNELAKLYDDDANTLIESWADLRETLLDYDNCKAQVEAFINGDDMAAVDEAIDRFSSLSEDSSEDEINEAANGYIEARNKLSGIMTAAETQWLYDELKVIDYDGATMLDFFMRDYDEVADDIESVYPLIASMTEGQRAGMDFSSLREYLIIALSAKGDYNRYDLQPLEKTSIYDGVDRDIYDTGGVALTSDALRKDAILKEQPVGEAVLGGWTVFTWVLTGICAAGAIGTAAAAVIFNRVGHSVELSIEESLGYFRNGEIVYPEDPSVPYMAKSGICTKLAAGFTAAMVIIAAVSLYLTWRDMKAFYKVDFTPIPRYMVEEQDITGYNSKGEKVVFKNQTAYYKAVECNRSNKAEFWDILGTFADMNGDVGSQWLALYAVKNEAMSPILASSLLAVVGNADIPAGYKTGIHMFGSSSAFNLNSNLYDWNQKATKVFVYFKTDDSAASSTGTTFTGGTLALTGGGGIAVGAIATAFAMKSTKKKKENPETA